VVGVSRVAVAENVWWRYEGRSDYALRGLSLEVRKGEVLAVMGHSGAGKTTLALALTGIIPQRVPGEFKGRVEVMGMSTLRVDVAEIAKRAAIVFEDPEIQFVMSTVEDEIALALEPLRLSRDEMGERIKWSLELVGLDESFLGRSPLQLSGGEKQRVAIAAAVAREPELLILDEPTSDLDPLGKEEVVAALKRLRDELDTTIVLVEHEPEYVAEFADRVAVLREGRVALEGEPGEVFSRVEELKGCGVYPPEVSELSARLGLKPVYRFEQALELLKAVVKGFRSADLGDGSRPGEVLIECRDVHYEYPGGVRALRGASLEVRSGELVALVGPNGSGKTTLAKVMCGLLKPSAGEVRVLGRRVDEYDRLALSSLVAYVYQNPDHQIFNKSVYEEVAFGLKLRGLPESEVKERVARALELFGLRGLENEHPFFLSKGEKRRLALASVYALDPKVLVVDEPTTGQDMRFSEALFAMLKRLTGEGRAVVVITHSVPIAARYADRFVVVKEGRVIASGPPRRVLTSPAADEGKLTKPQVLRLALALGLDSNLAPLSVEEFERVVEVVAASGSRAA
jgi:energy-coupling factor transport system ATP-binding protein